ncbi:hypothetical protein JZ751_020363 [Albula glossodonta]|uniref:Uncharacterized protein n=1 Tax=Albula glossodonta TaxID=121402 RepID=A0A8T2NNW2_9TELE|nr:hypothetical protein JZ751_020363 [Albula glossodonta]
MTPPVTPPYRSSPEPPSLFLKTDLSPFPNPAPDPKNETTIGEGGEFFLLFFLLMLLSSSSSFCEIRHLMRLECTDIREQRQDAHRH